MGRLRGEMLVDVKSVVPEIGLGTGLTLAQYSVHVRRITAVDPNPGLDKMASNWIAAGGIEVDRRRHWDLVDASAREIVGGYLHDKDRGPLDRLARSESLWERRIAIVSTPSSSPGTTSPTR